MTAKYRDVWEGLRGLEASMRCAADVYAHMMRQFPMLGGDDLPLVPGKDADLSAAVAGADLAADPRVMGIVPCETPPFCRPPSWAEYSQWLQGVAARTAAIATIMDRIGKDPGASKAIQAFEQSLVYRSEPRGRGRGPQS